MNAGFRLRGYAVERLLGSGASGDVWQARATSSGARVALKRIPVRTADQFARAEAEAALLSALDHPNLVRLHAVVPVEDALVLVLDLAEGGSLADLLHARGRLTPGETITAIAPVGAALAYLHDEGVVHGDVSAANILFARDGVPLLADVGVARLTGDDADAEATPAYVDPAVAAGCVPGPQSDVFMLAGVALHALTGEPTWPGDAAAALARAAAGAPDDVAGRLARAGAAPEMSAVLCRALSLDPHRRGTAADLALELRHSGVPVAVELAAGRARGDPRLVARSGPRHAAVPGRATPDDTSADSAGDPSRPDFARPGALSVGAPPPTRMVAPRPRPVLPRPQRRRFRLRPVAIAGAVLFAVILAIAGALSVRGGGRSGGAAARPRPQVDTPERPPVRAAQPGSAAGRASAPSASADPLSELERLDALRARAFATRDAALLNKVYVRGPLLRADAALLHRVVPAACGLAGVRTTYSDAQASRRGAHTVLTVTATLPPSRLVCGGTVSGRAAGTGPTRLRVELTHTRAGIRIAAERPA